MGCRLAGQPELHLGRFNAARAHLEQGLALFDPSHRPFYTALALQDARVMLLIFLSQALLCLGHPDQARGRWEEALAEARRLKHAFSLAMALVMACTLTVALAMVRAGGPGVRPTAPPLVEELTSLSAEQGFPLLWGMGTVYRGWCLAAEGQVAEGIAVLERGLAACRRAGTILWEPFFLALLADAHAKACQPEAGLKHLADAARIIEATQERWAAAEVQRLEGELLSRLGQQTAAEARFRSALATARRQDAKLWELRTATSLARFWRKQGKREEAGNLLAPLCTWFTEGLDTPDVENARALLAELRG
jgi:predicted ATPase